MLLLLPLLGGEGAHEGLDLLVPPLGLELGPGTVRVGVAANNHSHAVPQGITISSKGSKER